MKSAFHLIAGFCIVASSLAFGQSRLVIETDEYQYSANFDPSRITEERLRELLIFSPYDFGTYPWKIDGQGITTSRSETPTRLEKGLIPNSLELCVDNDPRYRPCGKRDITDTNFFINAEINLRWNDAVLSALDKMNVPRELQGILRQFRTSLAFLSTAERRRLEYLRSGDLWLLSKPIGHIDPTAECKSQIRDLSLSNTAGRRFELSLYEWQNCVNSAWNRVSPGYLEQDWQNFLRAYGIKEQFKEKAVD